MVIIMAAISIMKKAPARKYRRENEENQKKQKRRIERK